MTMKRTKHMRITFLLVGILAMLVASNAFAAGVKDRMRARLPVIMELKNRGVVGENNRGYLGFVGGSRNKANVVQAENNDRRQVYTAIAKQQKTSAAVVGQRRAKQLAGKARAGHWVQDAAGRWHQK